MAKLQNCTVLRLLLKCACIAFALSQFQHQFVVDPPNFNNNLRPMGKETERIPNEIITCQGRCGEVQVMPCSCDAQCLVYNNCCEDFAIDCPHTVEEGKQKYRNILGAEVECLAKSEVFVVTSCPKREKDESHIAETTMTTVLMNVDNDQKDGIENIGEKNNEPFSIPGKQNQQTTILKLLENAPVLDKLTGIVFKNFDIFSCLADNTSDPIYWSAQINIIVVMDDELRAILPKHVDERFIQENIVYLPPSDLDENIPRRSCESKSIGQCPADSVNNDATIKDRCERFMSYVKDKRSARKYNNRFCLMCNLDQNASFYPVQENGQTSFSKDFSVVVSLSGSQIAMKLQKPAESFGAFDLVPWKEASCDADLLSENTEASKDSILCDVTECTLRSVKRPDGFCKKRVTYNIAIGADGCPLNVVERQNLHKFVACLLKDRENMDILSQTPASVVYGTNTNDTLYEVQVSGYRPAFLEVFESIGVLKIAMKSFKKYRKCTTRKGSTHPKASHENGIIPTIEFAELQFYEKEIVNTTTTVCIDIITTGNEFDEPRCWRESIQEWELADIHKAERSPCFSVFDVDAGNGGSENGGPRLYEPEIKFGAFVMFVGWVLAMLN